MKRMAAAVLVFTAALAFYASGGQSGGGSMEAGQPEEVSFDRKDYEQWSQLLAENQVSEAFQEGIGQFSFESGSQVLKEEKGNAMYSPLSLYYALALAGCGAEGETEKEILGTLKAESKEELALQCQKLYQKYYYEQDREKQKDGEEYYMEIGEGDRDTIQIGNSLWISNSLPVNRSYQELAARQFFAPSYLVDFHQEETGKQMGEWISKQTNGVLAPELTPDPETMMTIINTLYFYGGWSDPFSKSMTKEDEFIGEDGTKTACSFMNAVYDRWQFSKGDGYTTSFLTTANSCRMVFLLPDEGRTTGEFLASPELLAKGMSKPEEGWTGGEVYWKVPKFSFGTSMALTDSLKAMGLEKMFRDDAEFWGISSLPLRVTDVIQETHIGVDEDGVEGAAYTQLMMPVGAILDESPKPHADMILDRPFIFGIQDMDDNWLFLGVCREPEQG